MNLQLTLMNNKKGKVERGASQEKKLGNERWNDLTLMFYLDIIYMIIINQRMLYKFILSFSLFFRYFENNYKNVKQQLT